MQRKEFQTPAPKSRCSCFLIAKEQLLSLALFSLSHPYSNVKGKGVNSWRRDGLPAFGALLGTVPKNVQICKRKCTTQTNCILVLCACVYTRKCMCLCVYILLLFIPQTWGNVIHCLMLFFFSESVRWFITVLSISWDCRDLLEGNLAGVLELACGYKSGKLF